MRAQEFVTEAFQEPVNEIAKMIGGRTEFIPKRLGESNVTLADISITSQILNWKPKVLLNKWIENNK